MILVYILSSALFSLNPPALAAGDHGKNQAHEHEHGHDQGHAKESDSTEEEHQHEEQQETFSPEKGITESGEQGFKLSAEALKNFGLVFRRLEGKGPWQIPAGAVLQSGEEENVYRQRAGYLKRIDFRALTKDANGLSILSSDLKEGDELVITGLGFLRIAELAATGGISHGHSH